MTTVESYLAAPSQSFWRWEDNGNVVTWSDGQTIAFRQEIATVYRRLRTQELPPFGAVVLLLAACRDSWSDSPSRVGLLSGMLVSRRRSKWLPLLTDVCNQLEKVRGLDAKLRTAADSKAELAAMVFEGQGGSTDINLWDQVLHELDHGLSESTCRAARPPDGVSRSLRDLRWLKRGLHRVDGASCENRLRTGLDQPSLVPVDVEIPRVGDARQLLVDLKDDLELGGVARLATMLLAAVHLPTPISMPAVLPTGGVSDISNRGTVDRLLLSELANDGLTLAVRVAMHEALYLRREMPPRPPARRRLVLLDSGLRMWGVPRIFATAVGLAFAAGRTSGNDVVVFRGDGDNIHGVDLTSAAGLADHLAVLCHRPHPGDSLAALAAEAEKAGGTTDVVIVTGCDVFSDPAFQRLLAASPLPEMHVALVDREGGFQLLLRSRRGQKMLRTASFAIDDILSASRAPSPPLIDSSSREMPAVFRENPFPLRLSYAIDAERSWHVTAVGAFTFCRDGRLLHWTEPGRGGVQYAEGLPEGNLHWAATRLDENGTLAIVGTQRRHGLHLVMLDTNRAECRPVPLEITFDNPQYAFVHDGVAFVGNATTLQACHRQTGEFLAAHSFANSITAARQVHSRFFAFPHKASGMTHWKAAFFDGAQIAFHEFYQEATAAGRVVSVFESEAYEGPVAVLRSGTLVTCGTGHRRETTFGGLPPSGISVEAVSRNGTRLLIRSEGSPQRKVVDVVKGAWTFQPLEAEAFALMKHVTLRHRFSAIGVDGDGRLTLVGRRDSLWPVMAETSFGLPSAASHRPLRLRQSFEPLGEAQATRYALSVARFADGSRVTLDARGLLHLRSSDEALPELTLVLVEGHGGGWISTSGVWGRPFFHDRDAGDLAAAPTEIMQAFVKHLE